jgi:hypothetical protein
VRRRREQKLEREEDRDRRPQGLRQTALAVADIGHCEENAKTERSLRLWPKEFLAPAG